MDREASLVYKRAKGSERIRTIIEKILKENT